MNNPDAQKFLDVALAAVKKAEPIFIKHFGNPPGVLTKHGKTPSLVSDADKEIEKLLAKEISSQFPGHSIVGEEFPPIKKESEFTWYVDPIDGTTNFVHGFAHCAVSVALCDAEGPLVGVVFDPVNEVTYRAVRGAGAFKNNKPITVSRLGALRRCLGALGWRWSETEIAADLLRRMARSVYRIRVLSSASLDLCLVAEGAFDFLISRQIAFWDVAAGKLILLEAGGAVSDWEGKPFTPRAGSICATNGKVHNELLSALR